MDQPCCNYLLIQVLFHNAKCGVGGGEPQLGGGGGSFLLRCGRGTVVGWVGVGDVFFG